MSIAGIVGQSPLTHSGTALDEASAAPPRTDVDLLAASARAPGPVTQGQALHALDAITLDRAASDQLVEDAGGRANTDALDYAASPQTAPGIAAPVVLSTAEKQQRVRAALPDAIASVRTAAADPALTPGERTDLTAASGALHRSDTRFTYGAIPNQPGAGAGAATHNGHATITINPNAPTLFRADGTVDKTALAAFLAHEGRHVADARAYGEPNGPTTLAEERLTERNAYRTEAAYLRSSGASQYTTDPTGTVVPLTAATANYAAENSVKSWVGAAAAAANQTNRAIDRSYATYTHQVAVYNHANGTHIPLQPRQAHVPVPTYSPPASY